MATIAHPILDDLVRRASQDRVRGLDADPCWVGLTCTVESTHSEFAPSGHGLSIANH